MPRSQRQSSKSRATRKACRPQRGLAIREANCRKKSTDSYEFVLPEKNWLDIIGGEFDQRYMAQLKQFLQGEEDAGRIYPKREEIFNALNSTPFKKIKVVILGQDPYHGEGRANGLCFSVPKGKDIPIPRSLSNIYREIDDEYHPIKMPRHGDLTKWAAQGVLLLNATLTVQQGSAGSHQSKGWEKFTDAIISAVNEKEHVVFLLWGRCAQKKGAGALIDRKKHKVLETWHPSARSARHRFRGCGHFKKANEYLIEHGLKPVEWQKI